MNMKKSIGIIGATAALSGDYLLPDIFDDALVAEKSVGANKVKKKLSDYYVPPRSMTEAENVYYERNKHLNGFYKS